MRPARWTCRYIWITPFSVDPFFVCSSTVFRYHRVRTPSSAFLIVSTSHLLAIPPGHGTDSRLQHLILRDRLARPSHLDCFGLHRLHFLYHR